MSTGYFWTLNIKTNRIIDTPATNFTRARPRNRKFHRPRKRDLSLITGRGRGERAQKPITFSILALCPQSLISRGPLAQNFVCGLFHIPLLGNRVGKNGLLKEGNDIEAQWPRFGSVGKLDPPTKSGHREKILWYRVGGPILDLSQYPGQIELKEIV